MSLFNVQLRLVTPAFCGGAEARQVDPITPIRPSSVRGSLRWWFRAAVAAQLWPASKGRADQKQMLDQLHDLESLLFGAVRGDALASAIALLPAEGVLKAVDFPAPDQVRSRGVRYLGYGLFEGGQPTVLDAAHTVFTQPIRLRPRAKNLGDVVAATVWLWAHLGGLGARTRRGWGSLELLDLGGLPWAGPPPGALLADPTAVRAHLVKGITEAGAVFSRFLRSQGHTPGQGEGPHPAIRTLRGLERLPVIPHTFPRGIDALEHAGRLFQDFRSTLQRNKRGLGPLPDYHEVKAAIQERPGAPVGVERAAFGLPLPFYFRSLQGAKATVEPEGKDRLASPLLFRVVRTQAGFCVALIHLASRAGSSASLDRDLRVRIRGRSVRVARRPESTLVNQFVDWAPQQSKSIP
jgi:CRISPR-associated protein Cmr1